MNHFQTLSETQSIIDSAWNNFQNTLSTMETPVVCVMCDSLAVQYFYPAPMCVTCNRDWAE